MLHRTKQLVYVDQVETRSCTRLGPVPCRDPAGKDDSREAGDIRSMNLSGYHEYPNFSRPSVKVGASKKHVEAALVGAERIEKERELQQALGMRGQRPD